MDNQASNPPEQTNQNSVSSPPPDPIVNVPEQAAPSTTAAGAVLSPGAEPATQQPDSVPPQKKSSKLMLILIIVVIAIIGSAAAAAVLLKPKSTPKSVTVTKNVQVLRVGTVEGPIGKDYLFPNEVSTEQSLMVDYQVFEGLVGYKNNATTPLLATSWTNPDKTTWVFKLKPGVKFQNGKTLTAEDVKTSFDALMQDEFWGQYLATVKEVKVSGPLSVTLITAQPDSLLLGRLTQAFVYSKNADGTVSGTGAYTFDTKNPPTDESVSLIAFDGYHQGKPTARKVQYTVYKDDTAIAKAMLAGQVDSTDTQFSKKTEQELAANGFTSVKYVTPGSYGLHLNMLKPNGALAKKEVRQALSYALDRTELSKKSDPGNIPTLLNVPQSVVGYDATATVPAYNVAKAKELQTAAGYPNGAPITFLYIKGLQSDPPNIIPVLKAAGFQVTENAVDSPKVALELASKGQFDIIAQSYFTTTNDATEIYSGMLSSTNGDIEVYNNPEFDAMIAASEAEFNPALHVKKVQEINKYVADNALWIPLYAPSSRSYAAPGLESLIKNFNDSSRVIYFWNVTKTVTATPQN